MPDRSLFWPGQRIQVVHADHYGEQSREDAFVYRIESDRIVIRRRQGFMFTELDGSIWNWDEPSRIEPHPGPFYEYRRPVYPKPPARKRSLLIRLAAFIRGFFL